MYIVLGVLAAAALGCLLYLFLSPKSSRTLKLAALGALILSGLAVGICGAFIVLGGAEEEADPYAFVLEAVEEAEPAAKTNVAGILIFLFLLLAFFGFIIFAGLRDSKKRAKDSAAQKAGNSPSSFSIDDDF